MANPISTATKDGTELLLFIPEHGWIQGRYFSSPKKTDDGWETVVGFIGEPTHWQYLPEVPK